MSELIIIIKGLFKWAYMIIGVKLGQKYIKPMIGEPLFWVIVIGLIILAIIGYIVERKGEKNKEKKNENHSHSEPEGRSR